jgi:hypothetical protein
MLVQMASCIVYEPKRLWDASASRVPVQTCAQVPVQTEATAAIYILFRLPSHTHKHVMPLCTHVFASPSQPPNKGGWRLFVYLSDGEPPARRPPPLLPAPVPCICCTAVVPAWFSMHKHLFLNPKPFPPNPKWKTLNPQPLGPKL